MREISAKSRQNPHTESPTVEKEKLAGPDRLTRWKAEDEDVEELDADKENDAVCAKRSFF